MFHQQMCTSIMTNWHSLLLFNYIYILIIAKKWRRKKRTDRQIFDGGVKWKLLYNKIIVHCAVPQSQIVKFEMSIVESWQIVSDPRQYAFDTQLHYLNYTIYLSLPPIPVATNFKLDSLYLILSSSKNILIHNS